MEAASVKNRNICENEPHSPLLLSGAGPHDTPGYSLKSPCPLRHRTFPFPLWFPWNTLLFHHQIAHSSTGFRPLLKYSLLGERSHTSHARHQHHPSLPLVLLSHSVLFLASLTASRDGAVGEGRCGERVEWYLLSTGFAGKEAVFLQRQGININCR